MALLSDDEVARRLGEVDGWRREGAEIVKDLEFADFAGAMAYVTRVAEVAEARNHHPDFTVHGWNKVTLRISNHSEGGLTEPDFALAGELDRL